MKNITTLLLLIILSIATAHSQLKQKSKIQYATIQFVYETGMEPDSLKLVYQDDAWFQISQLQKNSAKVIGKNQFRIPFKSENTFLYFYAIDVLKTGESGFMSGYLIEPNDDIIVQINKNGTLDLKGKGCEKFNLIYQIDRTTKDKSARFFKEEAAGLWNKKVKDFSNYRDKLKALIKIRDIKIDAMLNTIDKFSNTLPQLKIDLIKANFLGQFEYETAESFNYLNTDFKKTELSKSPVNMEELASIYFSRKTAEFEKLGIKALEESYGYQNYQYYISRKKDLFKNQGFNYLIGFSGILRDRLLTRYIVSEIHQDSMEKEWLNDAIKIVKTDYCRKILLNLASAAYPGKVAFPFALKDTSGNTVTMASLKGKVVLLDFYFTGCSGCRNLNEKMTNTYNNFKDNKGIVFVSVSIDKDIEVWKKSVKSELYSHKGSTNLYTNGLGSSHPIIKHYGIGAYPTVILIGKNGKLISANPPKPYDEQREKSLIALLTNSIRKE